MNYSELVDHIQREGKNAGVSETTSMDAVAFLPAHLGTVKARAVDLAKKKKDWKIEILEQEDSREVMFEDEYSIVVPNEHWDVFCSIFDSVPTNNVHMNLKGLLNETAEEELKDLRKELKVVLARVFDGTEYKKMDRIANSWKWRFPTINFTSREKLSVAITHEDRKNDIQELYGRLLEVYGEDRGNLEMLISALQSGEPLSAYEILQGYDYMYGTRIHSRYEGVNMHFESLVDMTGQLTQSIFTDNEDLLSKIEEESDEVKVVRSVIYPKGGSFTFRFLRLLSDVIEDLDAEKDEDEDE
jgi:hypothetical protein